jgi:hypothetical protein
LADGEIALGNRIKKFCHHFSSRCKMISGPTGFRLLTLHELESRFALAAMWPFGGQPNPAALLETYGQYQEIRGDYDYSIHHHEGIDLAAPVGTQVFAVMDGVISGIAGKGYDTVVSIRDANGTKGWNYKHITPADKIRVGKPVIAGQTLLGTVVAFPPIPGAYKGVAQDFTIPSHLHLDRGSDRDANPNFKTFFRPDLNPLNEFDNNLDTVAPTIGGVEFRIQADDKLGETTQTPIVAGSDLSTVNEKPRRTAHYFRDSVNIDQVSYKYLGRRATSKADDGTTIALNGDFAPEQNANIDLVVQAYDRAVANDSAFKLNIYRLGFEITSLRSPMPVLGPASSRPSI